MSAQIVLQIENGTSPGELLMRWSRGGMRFDPYVVNEGTLRRVGQRVRQSLQKLMREIDSTRDPAAEAQALRDLATDGNRLYRVLLPEKHATAEDVRSWLEVDMRSLADELVIVVPSRVNVPWGLVYEADPQALVAVEPPHRPEHYGGFWARRFKVAALYSRTSPKAVDFPRDAARFAVIPALHKETWDKVLERLDEPEIGALVSDFFGRRWQPVYTKRGLIDSWKRMADAIDVVYFYGHSNGRSLQIDDAELLTQDDMVIELKRGEASREMPPSLFILNGCDTAVGDLEGGFLECCGSQGCCGFVGSEAKLPERLAFCFGVSLLDQMLNKKKPLGEAVMALHERYWPMGLAFSMSCPPAIRVG